MNKHTELKPIPIAELMSKQFQGTNWYIEDLIPEGLTLLAGPAKIGKSFLAWNLATAIAHGGTALSALDCPEKRNVLYVALEDPEPQLRERIGMMCPDGAPDGLFYMTDFQDGKLNSTGITVLEECIDRHLFEFVIIDTWRHLAPPNLLKGSAYDQDYSNMIPVQQLAHRKGIGILLVTHTRKSPDRDNPFNMIQGSMGMQAGCDTMLMMKGSQFGSSLSVTGRRLQPQEYAISLKDGTWVIEGEVAKVHLSDEGKEILELLQDAGARGMKVTDIVEETKRKRQAISKQLKKMLEKGIVLQPEPRGKYYANDDDDIGFD